MKKLSKEQMAARDKLSQELHKTYDLLETAITEFNLGLHGLWEKVEVAIEAHNNSIQEANAWMESIATDIDDFTSDKSEKWLESERGSAYTDWHSYYDANLDEVEIERPEDLSMPDSECDRFDDLPEAPEV